MFRDFKFSGRALAGVVIASLTTHAEVQSLLWAGTWEIREREGNNKSDDGWTGSQPSRECDMTALGVYPVSITTIPESTQKQSQPLKLQLF
eukprot:4302884-Amphidinium_carterae.6